MTISYIVIFHWIIHQIVKNNFVDTVDSNLTHLNYKLFSSIPFKHTLAVSNNNDLNSYIISERMIIVQCTFFKVTLMLILVSSKLSNLYYKDLQKCRVIR